MLEQFKNHKLCQKQHRNVIIKSIEIISYRMVSNYEDTKLQGISSNDVRLSLKCMLSIEFIHIECLGTKGTM